MPRPTSVSTTPLSLPLFHIDLVAVGIQLLLLAIQNVLFYLDARGINVTLCALFFFGNIAFTFITIELGASFYGYGFAAAALLAALTGLWLLSRKFDKLEYETFMLQGR